MEGWRGCLRGRSGGLACCQARLPAIGGDGRWLQRVAGTRVLCADATRWWRQGGDGVRGVMSGRANDDGS